MLQNWNVRQIVVVCVFNALLYYFFGDLSHGLIASIFYKSAVNNKSERLYTKTELQQFNGENNPELYLSILGIVYDVSKGKKHYGKGETYHYFVGRDASRSFVTGKFNDEEDNELVDDFGFDELKSLQHWIKFYRKDYKRVGKLIGKYYDESGKATKYNKLIKTLLKDAENQKQNEDLEKRKFPPCNVEWNAEQGTRFWCTNRSGGVERNWAGKPRKLYVTGAENYRCACISSENEKLGNIKAFEGCDENSDSCYVKDVN